MTHDLTEETLPTLAEPIVDLRDPRWLLQPREAARALHRQGRVHRDTNGLWLVTRHADCRAMMQSRLLSRDPTLSRSYASIRPFIAGSALEATAERFILFADAPRHTRLRRVVGAAFTPAAVRQLESGIERTLDGLLRSLPGDEPFDFMQRVAQVLPIRVICDLLGLDEGDTAQAKAWSDAAACVVEPTAGRAQRLEGAAAVTALTDFLRAQVARRRVEPGDSLLDVMIAAQAQDPQFDDDDLLANLLLLFIAGHETTTNLLGNGLLALLQHPGQLERLRREPALLNDAIEEMMRWESPVNMVARTTLEPWTIGDFTVPPGEVLYGLLGAAHQDAEAFGEPHCFDITRSPNPQLAFGGGVHYCVGAPLARLEAKVTFGALLRRFGHLSMLDEQPRWRPMVNLRGLSELWIEAS